MNMTKLFACVFELSFKTINVIYLKFEISKKLNFNYQNLQNSLYKSAFFNDLVIWQTICTDKYRKNVNALMKLTFNK